MEPAAAAKATTAEPSEMRCGKASGLLKIIATLETPVLQMILPV